MRVGFGPAAELGPPTARSLINHEEVRSDGIHGPFILQGLPSASPDRVECEARQPCVGYSVTLGAVGGHGPVRTRPSLAQESVSNTMHLPSVIHCLEHAESLVDCHFLIYGSAGGESGFVPVPFHPREVPQF